MNQLFESNRNLPPLIESIANQKNLDFLLNNHHIDGFLYYHYPQTFKKNEYRNKWNTQWLHNKKVQDELISLGDAISEARIDVTLLKGTSLLDCLYKTPGERFMSDVDMLISYNEKKKMEQILIVNGFSLIKQNSWYGNDFKSEWTKKSDGIEINLELHTRLFFHQKNEKWDWVDHKIPPYKQLSLNDLFIHLCGHLAFQHNFIKLYWLFDLFLFLEKYKNEIDWVLVLKKSKDLKVKRSIQMVLWILSFHFNFELNIHVSKMFNIERPYVWKKILTKNFLLYPENNMKRYYWLKHLTKDSIMEAFKYDFYWALNNKILSRIPIKYTLK